MARREEERRLAMSLDQEMPWKDQRRRKREEGVPEDETNWSACRVGERYIYIYIDFSV